MLSISSQHIGHFPHCNTNSPGEGVGSGQSEHTVGVGFQVLPIPLVSMANIVENQADCWMEEQEIPKISISVVWGRTLQKLIKV